MLQVHCSGWSGTARRNRSLCQSTLFNVIYKRDARSRVFLSLLFLHDFEELIKGRWVLALRIMKMIFNAFMMRCKSHRDYQLKIQPPFIFSADLDGTLLPNKAGVADAGCLERTRTMLNELHEAKIPIAYFSSRTLTSAKQILRTYRLPAPRWWICNAGTAIYNGLGQPDQDWLRQIGPGISVSEVRQALYDIKGLTLQHGAHRASHTISFYSRDTLTPQLRRAILLRAHKVRADLWLTHSVEERTGRGIVQLSPKSVGACAVLQYLADKERLPLTKVMFAGDSGEDLQALVSGVRGVLVGNAHKDVKQALEAMRGDYADSHACICKRFYGDGVLQGLKLFRFVV